MRIVALGGLGEIGLNLMAVECAGRAIVIDCGMMFPDEPALGIGAYVPRMTWLEQSHLTIEAVVLTHAHEDHIGALAHLLRRFNVPVYGTDVTLAFTRRRLAESELDEKIDLRTIAPRDVFAAGPFTIEAIRVTHSTPNSIALAIRTPAGIIIHSGDFKIDDAPVDGEMFDRERFAQLGAEGVALLMSDSTNVERPGRSGSESSLKPILRELTSRARGRFFLSAFSSHLHRIRQVVEVSREFGRRVAPLGRRIAESVRLGMEIGQLNFPPGMFVTPDEAEFLEPHRLSYLASGSQGEPMSALAKLGADSHPRVRIEHGDVVVLSSRFIPGNERTINTLVNRLYRQGAEVVYDAVAPVHVSGHASQDELAELITLTRPKNFIPIHGEYRHLSRHVSLAIAAGIPEQNCFLLEDGDSIVLNGTGARRGARVDAGRVIVEGVDAGDMSLLGERRMLARDGTVTAILVVSAQTGRILMGPDLVSRGLVSGNGTSEHMRRATDEVRRRLGAIGGPFRANESRVKEEIVRAIRNYFSDELGKRPLVIPYVTEV
ncbi:MAG: ribonuclease J [Candidatus Binatus sp.]|uniref:ribonuclease J n=1 Tax=Candidatus Binatus sp. TaxID=2811406 RepID=UPI00272827C9|nr:ribonuclease J [Candidatus Binatus sp.]MDO8434529.1 ribonuclease J [Candidatus Binatus sp.]